MAALCDNAISWPEDWLNDAAKGFVVGSSVGSVVFASPGIIVRIPAIEQLLAMKLCAWRDDVDISDARELLSELIGERRDIWNRVEPYLYPGRELTANMPLTTCGRRRMTMIDQVAEAALAGDALQLRSIVQDWLRNTREFREVPLPSSSDPTVMAVAAALVEMFAERANQSAPDWTRDVLAAPEPLFLVRAARTMSRLRKLCEQKSPLPLPRRRIYAPPEFLTFA